MSHEVQGELDDFDKATTSRWNIRNAKNEDRNLLNCDVRLENLTLCTSGSSGTVLMDGCNLHLLKSRKYAVIGRNGIGKTTLLRHLAEKRIVGVFDHLRLLYIDDRSAIEGNDSISALQYLLLQHKERVRFCEALCDATEDSECADLDWLNRIHLQLELLNSDAAEARAHQILQGLGMDPHTPLGEMSGGWRHRCALAAGLFVEADILLLDEPTNNLDLEATSWLGSFLRRCTSTLVIVSHDCAFLDEVVTDVIAFEGNSLVPYHGDFSRYVETRTAKLRKHERMYKAQEVRRRQWQKTIDALSARASKYSSSRMIHSRKRAMQARLGASLDGVFWKLTYMGVRPEIMAPEGADPFYFDFPTDVSDVPESPGDECCLLEACACTFRYGASERHVLKDVDLKITVSSRIGILGRNGSGKTTLLKCLTGELRASVRRWEGVRLGIFPQDAVANLQGDQTALQWLCEKRRLHPNVGRNFLGSFGLFGEKVETQSLRTLSSGQRARILFADLLVEKPHVLLLDEPTSNLDAESGSALAEGLQNFQGGIVIASHDGCFLDAVVTEYYTMDESGMLSEFDGNYELYRRLVAPPEVEEPEQHPQTQQQHRREVPGKQLHEPSATALPREAREPLPAPQESESKHDQTKYPAVACRRCGGPHFTHTCTAPSPKTSPSATPKKDPPTPPQVPARPRMPPLREAATDKGGDWHVAVSKSTMRRLKKDRKS